MMRIQEHLTSESELFLAEVEQGLASINSSERDDLMNELRTHISELVTQGECESVREKLGDPKLYALELMKSAGFEISSDRSRFQRFSKFSTATKVLLLIASAIVFSWLVLALGLFANNFQVSSQESSYEIQPLVPDNFYVVPEFKGLPANYVVDFLTGANVPLCSATNLREGSLENLEVVSQIPSPGEVINSVIQCVELTLAPR